ncbi:MAG: hypothetical protein NTY33_01865 [Candidatus Moranbacteria bacterium]|nr:hypothetical protein [Candidatus Moranbacteria bacterium]
MQNKTKIFLVAVVISVGWALLANNAKAASCACGSATKSSYSVAPTSDLCQTGTGSVAVELDGLWQWVCGGTCEEIGCAARKTVVVNPSDCCCEDTKEKMCAPIACNDSCAGNKYQTACAQISDYTAKCSGTTSEDNCSSGTCLSGSLCMNLGKGTCKNTKNVCCLDNGGATPTPTPTSGSGITFPTNTGLPTNTNLVKGIFVNIANFLLGIIGIIALISFVISGVQYFLVATDEKMLETAKKTMMTSIIGIFVALFGYIAVKTVEAILKG